MSIRVEQLLSSELNQRASVVNGELDAARTKENAGDTQGAITEYRKVYQQRCLFPGQADEAVRRLRMLGVQDLGFVPVDNVFNANRSEKVERIMKRGLDAEMDDRYSDAQHFYAQGRSTRSVRPSAVALSGRTLQTRNR